MMNIILTWDVGDGDERKLTIKGTYSAGKPGRSYMPNGDPGYPDDPADFDIHEISDTTGPLPAEVQDKLIESDMFMDKVYELADETYIEDRNTYESDKAEYQRDQKYERERGL